MLQQSRDKLKQMGETYWANQVEIQREEVVAWLAFAEGHPQDALAGMRTAAALEDKTEKSAVTPGPLAPAREQLGELLLQLNQPAEALNQFELTLVKEPNRFRSLYGAAEAARLAGNSQTAQMYFAKLLKVAEHADRPGRQELAQARHSAAATPCMQGSASCTELISLIMPASCFAVILRPWPPKLECRGSAGIRSGTPSAAGSMGWGLRWCSTEEDAARGCRNNHERLRKGNDGQQARCPYKTSRICRCADLRG
jgi:tetratricopeptide (TPR) repeat protein